MSDSLIEPLLAMTDVPGIAVATIRNGRIAGTFCCGVRDIRSHARVDAETVFDAASLSKPVFAHAVLQLADEGILSLDTPLADMLPGYLPDDAQTSAITARHALSHSAGLPNWRSDAFPLRAHFPPGARFSYSGEGFLYLQKVVEALTGDKLHELAERLVLRPFGMARSSFVWEWRFDQNRATPHDAFGRPAAGWKPGEGNAAATLQTTAADYVRFLLNVLDGARLRPETSELWLRPQVVARHAKPQALADDSPEVSTGVAWGLGWGLEPEEGNFFHWGDNGSFKAFAMGSLRSRDAAVCFMNGASGLALMPELLSALIPGPHPSLAWLGYGRHDDPVRRMLHKARRDGAAMTWTAIQEAGLDADQQRWIAHGLVAAGRDEDARWLLARIEQDRTQRR